MKSETVKNYFEKTQVVADYAAAAENVGLWESERKIICEFVAPEEKVLELGCGAGRISLGLWKLGFSNLLATDFAENMVLAARALFAKHNAKIAAKVCDATAIDFADNSFDAVIFGFNGLMQIPKAQRRKQSICEIFRVLKSGGFFIFTTHDRDCKRNANYWEAESKQWRSGSQQPLLDDFGDIFYEGDHGAVFIHSPSRAEIEKSLAEAGFSLIFSSARADIADESQAVVEFSDDCIFWCAHKP